MVPDYKTLERIAACLLMLDEHSRERVLAYAEGMAAAKK